MHQSGSTIGTVVRWDGDRAGAILEAPDVPGGCWADASVVEHSTVGGGELRAAGEPRLVVEVGRQMPRLLLWSSDEKEAAGGEARLVQRAREVAAALHPARRREKLSQHLHTGGVHRAIVPGWVPG